MQPVLSFVQNELSARGFEEKPPLLWSVKTWLMFSAGVLLASLAGQFMIGLSTDHLDLMDQVRRLFNGGQSYISYADINPPLIHLLYALPWLISDITGIPTDIMLDVLTFTVGGAGLYCLYKLCWPAQSWDITCLLLSSCAIALFSISFNNQVFADRDHLMLCFMMPWLVLHSPIVTFDKCPSSWRRVAAILAALGIALKPYNLLVYLCCFAFNCYRITFFGQLRRIEHWLILGVGICYAAFTITFFPAYLTEIVPLLWHTYDDNSWLLSWKLDSMLNNMLIPYWPSLVFSLFAAYYVFGVARETILYLLVLEAAGVALYLINAGWWYTQYFYQAINCLLCMASAAALWHEIERQNSLRKASYKPAVIVAFFSILFYCHIEPAGNRALADITSEQKLGRPMGVYTMDNAAFEALRPHMAAVKRYIFFSTNLRALSLKAQGIKAESVGRYDHIWPLAGLAKLKDDAAAKALYEPLMRTFMMGILEDMRTHKPERIIVDTSPYLPPMPKYFGILPFMRTYDNFNTIWQYYTLLERIDTCTHSGQAACSFEVYAPLTR